MDRRLLANTAYAGLGTALLAAILFIYVDQSVDYAARALKGGVWYRAAETISLLADHDWFNVWLSAGLILGGVLALAVGPRPAVGALVYVCVAVALTMTVGETLKWLFGRYRPEMLFEHSLYGFSWFAAKGAMHSFPSGHTFRIFSAMTALSLVWPRARVPLLAVAALVAVCRVAVTMHFPSDVLVGAFLGVVCAVWVHAIMRSRLLP